jgi:hypothetical protein
MVLASYRVAEPAWAELAAPAALAVSQDKVPKASRGRMVNPVWMAWPAILAVSVLRVLIVLWSGNLVPPVRTAQMEAAARRGRPVKTAMPELMEASAGPAAPAATAVSAVSAVSAALAARVELA